MGEKYSLNGDGFCVVCDALVHLFMMWLRHIVSDGGLCRLIVNYATKESWVGFTERGQYGPSWLHFSPKGITGLKVCPYPPKMMPNGSLTIELMAMILTIKPNIETQNRVNQKPCIFLGFKQLRATLFFFFLFNLTREVIKW